jgi:general stress protein 26
MTARVQEALQRTDIMALSTIGPDGSWTSPVQYHHDNRLNLYFMSLPDAKHLLNIQRDPRVSLAIYCTPGPLGGNLGLQIRGTAEHLPEESTPGSWQSFKITPREVWCFDSRVERKRRKVDLVNLDLDEHT